MLYSNYSLQFRQLCLPFAQPSIPATPHLFLHPACDQYSVIKAGEDSGY